MTYFCSNPKVQIKCLDAGILPILVRMLAVESSRPVRARLLSACSAFIRQFPYAQEKFITLGGLQTLVDVFSNKYTNDKLRLKIVTLLHDLLAERVTMKFVLINIEAVSKTFVFYVLHIIDKAFFNQVIFNLMDIYD